MEKGSKPTSAIPLFLVQTVTIYVENVNIKQKCLDERMLEPLQPVIFKENGPRLDFPRNFTAFARPDLVF